MAIPTYQDYYLYILMYGDEPKSSDEYLSLICDKMKISEHDQQVRNSSGEPTVRNRLRWSIHYLRHAKMMEKPTRGKYVITKRGDEIRKKHGLDVDNETLKKFEEFREFKGLKKTNNKPPGSDSIDKFTPEENIENGFDAIHKELKLELKNQIFDLSPYFFEKLVLDLLKKMGYGSFYGTRVTSKSNDGGIDGIVYQDALGLEIIYIQAKRYQQGNNIGRVDLQKFNGSLNGRKASKGIFVTCSDFTKDAIDYLNTIPQNIVCVNGEKLLSLLLEHEVGVELREIYKTYKIDEDYFSE